jgi:predicted  nucleic acid-binding Zn-ribbon protein
MHWTAEQISDAARIDDLEVELDETRERAFAAEEDLSRLEDELEETHQALVRLAVEHETQRRQNVDLQIDNDRLRTELAGYKALATKYEDCTCGQRE